MNLKDQIKRKVVAVLEDPTVIVDVNEVEDNIVITLTVPKTHEGLNKLKWEITVAEPQKAITNEEPINT